MNQPQDSAIIRELYLASQKGVPITLNVRGLCCLRAQVPGLSPTIKVFSALGRFLEHGRIYRFESGGDPVYLTGSADWMRCWRSTPSTTARPGICSPMVTMSAANSPTARSGVALRTPSSAWLRRPPGSLRRGPRRPPANHRKVIE